MISIIIPAYNEEAVIERCLRGLTQGARPGEIEIIVACNGCRDRTAEIARQFGPPVRVVETTRASKIEALNLGDAAAHGFPRCFIDADIEVSLDTVRRVAALLEAGPVLAAAPAMQVDDSRSSWAVRAFYRIWLRQPFHGPGMLGGGFYALSRAGRARFDSFPQIIADDEFVRTLFDRSERGTPTGGVFTIRAPRTLRDLIKVKTRSRLGRRELRMLFPERYQRAEAAPPDRQRWRLGPRQWPSALVYLFVVYVTHLRASRQASTLGAYRWERDESSRRALPSTG